MIYNQKMGFDILISFVDNFLETTDENSLLSYHELQNIKESKNINCF